MRSIPDSEDGSQPSSTQWFKSAPRRHRAHAHARTTRTTERIDLSRGRYHLVTPMFQPLRGEAGRTWFAIEYGISTDNSSLMSSESAAEREDTDEEIMSFDLGPEPLDPLVQDCLPSDKYLDDLQQGLIPGGSEPKMRDYDAATNEMSVRHSLIDTMHQDMDTALVTQEDTPMNPERAPAPIMGFSYDYMTDDLRPYRG